MIEVVQGGPEALDESGAIQHLPAQLPVLPLREMVAPLNLRTPLPEVIVSAPAVPAMRRIPPAELTPTYGVMAMLTTAGSLVSGGKVPSPA